VSREIRDGGPVDEPRTWSLVVAVGSLYPNVIGIYTAHRKDFVHLVGGVLVMVMVSNECSPEISRGRVSA